MRLVKKPYELALRKIRDQFPKHDVGKLNESHSDVEIDDNVSRCDNALVLASDVDGHYNNGVGRGVNNISVPRDLVCFKPKLINEYNANCGEEKKILDEISIEIEKLRSRRESVFNIPGNSKEFTPSSLKIIVIQIYASAKKRGVS